MRIGPEVLGNCPKCKQPTLKEMAYKLTKNTGSRDLDKTLSNWGLNAIIEYRCTDDKCGFMTNG